MEFDVDEMFPIPQNVKDNQLKQAMASYVRNKLESDKQGRVVDEAVSQNFPKSRRGAQS